MIINGCSINNGRSDNNGCSNERVTCILFGVLLAILCSLSLSLGVTQEIINEAITPPIHEQLFQEAPSSLLLLSDGPYVVGETIAITSRAPGDSTLLIEFGDSRFRHLGDLSEALHFVPREIGEYTVTLILASGEQYVRSFTVLLPGSDALVGPTDEESTHESSHPAEEPDSSDTATVFSTTSSTTSSTTLPNPNTPPSTAKRNNTAGVNGSLSTPSVETSDSELSDGELPFSIKIKSRTGFLDAAPTHLVRKRGARSGGGTDIELIPHTARINKIQLRNVRGVGEQELNLDEIRLKKSDLKALNKKSVVSSYFIDTANIEFDTGTLESTATGKELWKCRLWDAANNQCDGTWEKVQDLVPGEEYSVAIYPGDPAYVETGVATINTRRPIYQPRETVEIVSVVLNREGIPTAHAAVTVEVTTPDNRTTTYSTAAGTVTMTSKGIFEVRHADTTKEGIYSMFVRAVGPNVDHSMFSEFTIQESFPFDIVRSTPVTIDPWRGPFLDKITITPLITTSHYSFTEKIPDTYTILEDRGGLVQHVGSEYHISWYNLTNKSEVGLLLRAPLISPDIAVFGTGTVTYDEQNVTVSFEEARPWYLAVDPYTEWYAEDGTAQFSNGQTQLDVPLTRELDDLSRSFMLMTSGGDSGASNAAEHQVTGYIYNTTHLRFNRDSGGDTPTVGYHVIENTGGDIFVQRGEIVVGSGSNSNTDSLSASVHNNSFITLSTRTDTDDTFSIYEGYGRASLTNNNTVQCTRAPTTGSMTCRYEVVTSFIPSLTVQTGTTTITGTSATETFATPVDMSRSLLLFNYDASNNGLTQTAIGGQLTNTNEVSFYRYTGTYNNVVRWYVIQFPNGTSVQRGTIDGSSTSTSGSETGSLSPSVILGRSFGFSSATSNGVGRAFPRTRWVNYFTNSSALTMTRYRTGQEFYLYWQAVELNPPNLIPNVTTLSAPSSGAEENTSFVDFDFIVIDDSDYLTRCWLYTNVTGSFAATASRLNVQNNTETNISYEFDDGEYFWNIQCQDWYGSKAFHYQNKSFTVRAAANIYVNDIEGDTSETYSFSDQSPTINFTVTNRDATCYLSAIDESYSEMVSNGRTNCGSYTEDVKKACTYGGSLAIGNGALHIACQTTTGVTSTSANNKDVDIDVECDSHTDCPSTQYCDYNNNCYPDVLPGYNCFDLGFEPGPDDAVCGDGSNRFCVNDSSYSYTGWYCTADADDCVYNDNGNSYDVGEVLCISGYNDYRACGSGNEWGAIVNCSDQFAPANQTAVTRVGAYCGYYAADQTCVDGVSGGCVGNPTDCGSHIYNQSTFLCGSTLKDCDIGCGAECDSGNSTAAGIANGFCYFDKSCDNACSWNQDQEEAPDYCINDNNGGSCSYDNRTNPSFDQACYWDPLCQDGSGASLSQGSAGNLRANYCDFCNASGSQVGPFAPEPNATCGSGCADGGIIYYDVGATPGNRNDDCDGAGGSTILSDTLSPGDIWNGTGPAHCTNVECDADCGTFVGVCSVGVCVCTDEDYPLITLFSPNTLSWSSSAAVSFKYNVSDASSGIENCSLFINDSLSQTNFSITETVLEQQFIQSFTNGSYSWWVRCFDNSSAYNYNDSLTRIIGVDTVFPSISNPNANGTEFNVGNVLCLNVTASDVYSGLNRVYAELLLPTGGTEEVDLSDSISTSCDPIPGDGVFSADYPIGLAGDFNWTYAYAVDRAGNAQSIFVSHFFNASEGGNLTVELTAPTADLKINESEFNNAFNTNFTVSCNATCNEGFIDCHDVKLSLEYENGTDWNLLTPTSDYLWSNTTSYSCGDISAIQAPWWNESFAYRQQMRIVARSAIASDHVVRVDYNTTGPNFRDDADDLRIVFWNGTENIEVDRQVFRPNETDSSIWFTIGQDLGSNESTYYYYLYFGYENATNPKDNESNIWLFYDDFSDGTYTDKWGYSGGVVGISSTSNPWTGTSNVLSVGSCGSGNSFTKVLTSELPAIRDVASRILWLDNPGSACTGGSPDADGIVGIHGSATATYDGILVERDTDTGFHFDNGATGSLSGSQYYSPFDTWQWSETYSYGTAANDYKARYWLYTEAEPNTYPLVASTVTATGAGQPFIRVYSGVARVAVVMIRPTVALEPYTQLNPAQSTDVPIKNHCTYDFVVSSDDSSGNKEFPVRCRATSSNSQFDDSLDKNITVNDHPAASFFSPSSGDWLTDTVILNATPSSDADGSLVRYRFQYDNTTAFASPSTICDSVSSTCSWNTLLQNQCLNNSLSCFVRVSVFDNDGLVNNSVLLVGFDTAGPTTVLDRARFFENITSNSFVVNASASDATQTVDTVFFEYRVNAGSPWSSVCNTTTAPYSCSWNLSGLSDGVMYEIRARANDSLGNLGSYDVHTNVTVDRKGPFISLSTPANNDYLNSSSVMFHATVTDVTSVLANCSLYIDEELNQTNSSVMNGQTISFAQELVDDVYLWNLSCFDVQGNGNWSEIRNVTIDTVGPVSTLIDPSTFEQIIGLDTYIVNATITDAGIGVVDTAVFEFREDSSSVWQPACTDSDGQQFSCNWDLTVLDDGTEYEVRVRANDTLGTYGDWDTRTNIILDRNGPVINLSYPQNDTVDNDGDLLFTYVAHDVAGTIANCSLYWNGALNQTNSSITEGVSQDFVLTNISNGNYTWSIECTDSNGQTTLSETRDVEIVIIYRMLVDVYTDAFTFQKGDQKVEEVNITTNTSDLSGNPLSTDTTTDIIRANTSVAWWNTSWGYRRPIVLEETSGSAQNDAVVEVTVNTQELVSAGQMLSNCFDARFTYDNGTVLPHHLANGCGTSSTSFYLSRSFAGDEQMTVYFYYDNPSASNTSTAPPRSIIGEAGTVSVADFNWILVPFDQSYTVAPIVFATPATQNGSAADDDSALVPAISMINTTHMNITICQDNGAITCDPTVNLETLHYFVFDADKANQFSWMAVGTETVTTAGSSTSVNYGKTFSSTPVVWTTAQTYSQGGNIAAHAWTLDAPSKTTSSVPLIGCVHQAPGSGSSVDVCESGQPSETFGFLAIDTSSVDIDTFQSNSASISASTWTAASFSPSYSSPIVMVTQNSENGGQDPQYPWARDVVSSGMDFRYCEADAADVCDSHNAEDVYWFAVEEGPIRGPTALSDNFSVSFGSVEEHILRYTGATGLGGIYSYSWDFLGQETGLFSAVSRGKKLLFTDGVNATQFRLINDSAAPNVTLNAPADGAEANSSVTFTYFVDDALSSVDNCSLYIDGQYQDTDDQIEEGPVQFFFPRIPSGGAHNWSVICWDAFSNPGYSVNYSIVIKPPDLTASNYSLSDMTPQEGANLSISALLENIGGSNAFNVTVLVYDDRPDIGTLIYNQTLNNLTDRFGDHQNESILFYWTVPGVGEYNVTLLIDPPVASNGSIQEINESNNEYVIRVVVPSYQYFYGNVTAQITLDVPGNDTFVNFTLARARQGHILVAAKGGAPDFSQVYGLGRTSSEAPANLDFTQADAALNLTGYNDSIKALWGAGTDSPAITLNKTLFNRNISFIPFHNISGSTRYTGILWDASDDVVDGEFDDIDSEDLIFFTQVEYGGQGVFGINDYEIQVPAPLRSYKGGSTVEIYFELL